MVGDTKLLSIIVPFYNSGTKIDLFIESILSQNLESVELIFVDDGSVDNTGQRVVDKLNYSNIVHRVIKKVNGGVSSARNIGISFARGEYVIFVDSDDALLKNSISNILKFIALNKRDDFLIFDYIRFKSSDKNKILEYQPSCDAVSTLDTKEVTAKYISGNLNRRVHVCSCIYKLNFLNSNMIVFDERFAYGEDQKFVIDCLIKANSFKYFKTPILAYVENENSATSVYNSKWFDSYTVFKEMLQRDELKCFSQVLICRMNNELLSIANKIILTNGIFESIDFLKGNILPLKGSIQNKLHYILFHFPALYVFLYGAYKKLLVK